MNRASDSPGDSPVLPGAASDCPDLPVTVYMAIGLPAEAMPGRLIETQLALDCAARQMTQSGRPVRFLNGMYMPAQARLLCVFAAETEEAVHAAVELAQLPFAQVKSVTNDWDQDQGPAPENGEPDR